jgi:hypothetical protein
MRFRSTDGLRKYHRDVGPRRSKAAPPMTRLTKRRIWAIQEALRSRLAGEIKAEFGDDFELKREDYAAAEEWANEMLERRNHKEAP